MSSYELLIGLRYTRAKRRNHFISVISLISMAGIGLGVAALIVVLSVMNGFQKEIRARILGAASHVDVIGINQRLQDWAGAISEASAHPQVVAAAPYVNGQGMFAHGQAVRGALVRGIVPALEDKVVELGRHMKAGSLADLREGEFNVVLGVDLARSLGARLGDSVVLITPQGQVTPAGLLPRLRSFKVAGVFEVGHFEFDSGLALIHAADAQKLFRLEQAVTGIRLKLKDLDQAPLVARDLTRMLTQEAFVTDWTRSHANYFRAVQIEKRMMFIILTLIVAVAAFNIVSTLVMAVTDKQADIAILRTLGAAPGSIMKIFMVQGALIGVIGTVLGVTAGVALALNIDVVVPAIERAFGIQFLDKGVYYISELPSDMQSADVIVVAVVSLVLSLLATLYPSLRAARINPAEALRYE